MRVEVLVTGLWPTNLPISQLKDCIYRLRRKLGKELRDQGHSVVYRWQTWDQFKSLNKLVGNDHFVTNPEPLVNYTPYKIDLEEIDAPVYIESCRRFATNPRLIDPSAKNHLPALERGLRTRILQILGTVNLIESRGDAPPPDMYIRVRWDSVLDWNFDFNNILRKVREENCVVGFQQNVGGRGKEDLPCRCRERFERGVYKIVQPHPQNMFWYQRLFDYMIVFKPEWFDLERVKKLHEDEKLKAAEWGWWQTLCKSNEISHINYNGVVTICRSLTGDEHDGVKRWIEKL